jgi:histidyl-tRNA synthetase
VLAERLRDEIPGLRVLSHCGGGSFKSQFKKADKSGAKIALILGDDEISNNTISVKFLREDKPQEMVEQGVLSEWLVNYFDDTGLNFSS